MIIDITLSNDTISEGVSNGISIANIVVINDISPHNHMIILLDDADGRFVLDGNYIIVLDTTKIDYETDISHNITLRAIDEDGLYFDKGFIINITNSTLVSVIYSIEPKTSKEGTNPVITIKGNHFSKGGEPTVRIDGESVNIISYSDTEIKLLLINKLPANVYTVSVFNGMGL